MLRTNLWVIALEYRPGHFLVRGHPFAAVWPPEAAGRVSDTLGMPAVMIRQLEALAKIMAETSNAGQRRVLLDQAAPPPGHVAMLTIRERRRGDDGDMDQCRAFPAARGPDGRGGAS